jgi:protein-S-isoprenylcysteine O-methyltransferase Ste14
MSFQHRLQRSFKPRFAVIYPFGLFFLAFGTIDNASVKAGIGYIIAGFLIRLWSNGYAIKNDKLTISGPYAFVRNPLYLGTFLIAVGFMFLLKLDVNGGNVVKLLFLGGLAFMYYKTIGDEQGMLKAKFGKAYENYCAKIPAMIPCLTPYTEGEQWPFSLDRLIYSKEYKTIVWITVIIIAFHLKTRLLVEHKGMTGKTYALIALAALMILTDIFYEINKKKK